MLPADLSLALPSPVIALASVLGPMIAAVYLWCRRPLDRRQRGAIALSFTWNLVMLLPLNSLAVRVGWWRFDDAGPQLLGVSVALWLGWALLWGVVAPLIELRPLLVLAGLAVFDIVGMPLLHPALVLESGWLVGEVLALALIAWPGLMMSQWMWTRSRLGPLVVLEVAMFSVILLWLIPALAVEASGSSWAWNVSPYLYGVVVGSVGLVSLPAVTGVYDFYLNGGSPWPWDTTARPVRSGAYRYVRSPMQASAMGLLLLMAAFLQQPAVVLAALSAVGYSRLFSQSEFVDLSERFGGAWSELANQQRRWVPSFRPSEKGAQAVVWIDAGCEVCSPVARFLLKRSPVGLDVRDAAEHPEALTRMRYERDDRAQFSGVQAFGASLEHLHLGWAFVGWLLRAPVLSRVWQLIGDDVGFGPRPVSSRSDADAWSSATSLDSCGTTSG